MDRGPGGATVHRITKEWSRLSGHAGSALHMAGGFFTRRAVREASAAHRDTDTETPPPPVPGATLRTQQAGPESSQEPHRARPRDLILRAFLPDDVRSS